MEQRSYLNELVLVVVVAVFVVGCAAIFSIIHRTLPNSVAAAIGTSTNSVTSSVTATVSSSAFLTPTPASAAAQTTKAAPSPTPHPTPALDQYQLVTGRQLAATPDKFVGKKIAIGGSIYYVDPRGSTTWVQVLTVDNTYVDINFPAPEAVQRGEQVHVYGIGAGTTVIRASNGNLYTQPFINPGQFIQKS